MPQIHHISMPTQNGNLNRYVVSVQPTDQLNLWVRNLENSPPWRAQSQDGVFCCFYIPVAVAMHPSLGSSKRNQATQAVLELHWHLCRDKRAVMSSLLLSFSAYSWKYMLSEQHTIFHKNDIISQLGRLLLTRLRSHSPPKTISQWLSETEFFQDQHQ